MKRIFKLLIVFLLFFSFSFARTEAPDFILKNLEEKEVILSSYRKKNPVILIFWNTRCPFCIRELLWLKERHSQFIQDNCKLIAVNIGESISTVKRFLKKIPLDFEIVFDYDLDISEKYGLWGVPTYVFIDKEGNIFYKGHLFNLDKYHHLIEKTDE